MTAQPPDPFDQYIAHEIEQARSLIRLLAASVDRIEAAAAARHDTAAQAPPQLMFDGHPIARLPETFGSAEDVDEDLRAKVLTFAMPGDDDQPGPATPAAAVAPQP